MTLKLCESIVSNSVKLIHHFSWWQIYNNQFKIIFITKNKYSVISFMDFLIRINRKSKIHKQ